VKIIEDIYEYYPETVLGNKDTFPDFAIIRLDKLTKGLDDDHMERISKPHLRGFFEISIGLDEPNLSYVNVGSAQFPSIARNIVFVSPVQPFSVIFNRLKEFIPGKGYILAFKPSVLTAKKRSFEIMNTFRFFNSYAFPQHILNSANIKPIVTIADNLYNEYNSNMPCSREIIGGYMEVLLHSFNRILKLVIDLPESGSGSCDYIAANFERKVIEGGNRIYTIARYAEELNVSTNYLSECVKKSTGRSAKQILLNHKLIIAKSMLQQPDKTISDVAFEMGFTETTNFTKFFKRMTGQTPNQFRASDI
jgi:AraC-like DNA-binding protein